MRLRAYIGCFGSGLGHASRMLEVAQALRARGDTVHFSSSGEAAELISSRGFWCNDLPLADVRYSDTGEFQVKETLLDSPLILGKTTRQFRREIVNIKAFSPDVVMSDSSLPTVLAGRAVGLPTLTVLNQVKLSSSHGKQGALARLLSAGTSAGVGRFWRFSDEILFPDLPPPYTISEENLWGTSLKRTRYVGFLYSSEKGAPDPATESFASDRKPKVFWQVSGPPRTRAEFLKVAVASARALSERYTFVISGGDPGGERTPSRRSWGWYYGWCGNADFYFGACDALISRAGHGTISHAITASKPSLLVPIPRQPEQEGNAEKAQKLGVARTLHQEALAESSIAEALEDLLSGGYAQRAASLGRVARGLDARSEIIRSVDAAAARGHR